MVTPVPILLRRRNFWLYAMTVCAALLALCFVAVLAIYEAPIWSDATKAQGLYGAWVQGIGTLLAGAGAIFGGYLAFKGAVKQGQANLDAAAKQIAASQLVADEARMLRARALASVYHHEMSRAVLYLDVSEALVDALKKPPRLTLVDEEEAADDIVVIWDSTKPKFLTVDLDQLLVLGVPIIRRREMLASRFNVMVTAYEFAQSYLSTPDEAMDGISREQIGAGLQEQVDCLRAEMMTVSTMLFCALEASSPAELDSLQS